MPESNQEAFLQLALKRRLLTSRQADFIRKESGQGSVEDAAELMLRRHYVTKDQLRELWEAIGEGTGAPAPSAPEKAANAPQTATAPQAPAPERADLPTREEVPKQRDTPPVQPPMAGRPAPGHTAPPGPKAPAKPAATTSGGTPQQPKTLPGLLRLARHWGCSDLHLAVGRPPFVRLNGQIRYMEREALTPEVTQELLFSVLTPEQRDLALQDLQLDFSLEIPKSGRYRCNVFRQRTGWDGSFRIVPAEVPTFEGLGLPESLRVLTEYTQGLVLVTGAGGSGKTTTVAAMVDLVNRNRHEHIITVEDPVEYVFPPVKCQVTQREVGRHTQSFANALRAALREDPDVILIGEMRDLETTSIAISAAETGHLVFGTLHTSSAARTVARIVDLYPINQQTQVCHMVAESLRGVISQQLVPRKDQSGRALALEIMINTTGISTQIKEGKTHLITSLIQGGKKLGMVLMDESLANLHRTGIITGGEAYRRAGNKAQFEAVKDDN